MMERIPPIKQVSLSAYNSQASIWKIILLGFLTISCALLSGYFGEKVLSNSNNLSPQIIIPFSLFFAFFLSFFLISVLFIERRKTLILIAILTSVSIVVPFWSILNQEILIGGAIMTVVMVLAVILGRRELDSVMTIRFFSVSQTVLSKVILSIAIFLTLLVYSVFADNPLGKENVFLSEKFFVKTTEVVSKSLGGVIGGFDMSISLKDLVDRSVYLAIEKSGVPASQIKSAVIEDMKVAYIKDYKEKIEALLGSPININQKISLAVYNSLLNKFNALDVGVKSIVLGVMSFVIFLTLLAVSPIIRIVISFLSFLIYEFLMMIKFGSLVYENKSKEIIILP